MIKVKDGYAKLIGTTYQGSATLVLLSNGGNLEFSSETKASTLVKRNASLHIYATYFNSAISDEALSDIGSVYVRNTSDSFIRRISKSQFYSIIDDKFVTLDTALTITGTKTFSTSPILTNVTTIILNQDSTSNYSLAIKWLKGGTSLGKKYDPSIGLHNTGGDGTGSICILPYPTNDVPWGGTVGLFIGKGILKLDGKDVLHSGNYDLYLGYIGTTKVLKSSAEQALTGISSIDIVANKYWSLKDYGLNLNNSDIIGANGIYFRDIVDDAGEGLNFYRTSSTWDTLTAAYGVLYFSPNRSTSTHTLTPVFSNLTNSNNNISLTIGGTNRTLLVGYSSNSSMLNGYGFTSYIYRTAYHYTTGCLVTTNIPETSDAMVVVDIIGNGYVVGTAINTKVLLYLYNSGNAIISYSAINHGYNFGDIYAFDYNGYLCLWFKLLLSYQSFLVSVYQSNGGYGVNRVISLTATALPTDGITRKVTITPVSAFTVGIKVNGGSYTPDSSTTYKSGSTGYITIPDYVTSLGTSGSYLTWTKGNTTNNLTVPYASTSNEAYYLYSHDTRNINNTPATFPAGARFEFKSNSTDGLNDGKTYHGILHFKPYGPTTDFSGGLTHLLGFTDNGNLYMRTSTSSTEWGSWKLILSLNTADGRYVKVAGDTMTGALIVNSTITGTLLISNVANGTAPLKVTSKTVVTNLNADLLDGYDATSFVRSFWTNNPGYDCSTHNYPSIISFTYSNNAPFGGAFIDISAHYYGFYLGTKYSSDGPLYYRRHGRSDDGGMGEWLLLARITDNVASATKLLTARSINGTSFDGTADITTAKWGAARTITLSGAVTGSASVDGSLAVTITTTYQTGSIDGRYVGGKKAADHSSSGTAYTADTYSSNFVNKSFVAYAERGSWAYANNGYITTDIGVNIPLAGTAIFQWGASDINKTLLFITPYNNSGVSNPASNEMLFYTSNGSAYTSAWTRVLTNRNYTSYTVTKTGSGASGTWDISITGTANRIISSLISDTLANKTTPGCLYHAGGTNSVKDKPSGVDAFGVFTMLTANGYYGQLLISSNESTGLYWRTAISFNGGWRKVIDSSNYTEYVNPANYVTSLGTNGNYITWTKNGTTNNITVPYATKSQYTTGFYAEWTNNWDCNNPDRVVYSDYGSSGRSITNAPSGWNYGTLLELGHTNLRGLNANLNMQLMWDVAHSTTNSGTLWFRTKDSTYGWAKKWSKVITDYNISSILNDYYTKTESDKKYVTLTTSQTVSGIKTFSTLLKFTVATGTSPFTVSSTTVVSNLNSDMLDGRHASGFILLDYPAEMRDYYSYVIGLVRLSTIGKRAAGRIYLARVNILYKPVYIDYILGAAYSTGSSPYTVYGTVVCCGRSYPVVTFKYNGEYYAGFKLYADNAQERPYVEIAIRDIDPFIVAYYNNLDKVVINSEINDSLSTTTRVSVTNRIYGVASAVVGTLTLSSGKFSSETYDGLYDVTANIPTNTSHLTNDSGYWTGTLTFSSGKFSAKTYSGTGNETINIPTNTSHLTNDSGYWTGTRYWANIAVSTSSSTTTSPTFANVYLGNCLYLNNKGNNSIYNGSNDAANGVGGDLNNLVFSSLYGVSFTTDYSGQTYTNKNAVSINCRTGLLSADTLSGNRAYIGGYNNGSYSLSTSSFICLSWIRSVGTTGWYNETHGGGIHMIDDIYVRVYNNKIFYSSGGYLAPYSGSNWITMATRTNCIIADENNTESLAHALFRVKDSSGNAVAFGGISNNIGFYGFTADRIGNNTNGTDWSTVWDAKTGAITHSNTISTSGYYHSAVNSNNYVLLAGGSYKSLSDFVIGNAGSTTLGVYISNGSVEPMTYSLKANVNSGTSNKLAYYSNETTLSSHTLTVGNRYSPIYLNAGVPMSCSDYSFLGSSTQPVVLISGYFYRNSTSSNYWYYSGYKHSLIGRPTFYCLGGVMRLTFSNNTSVYFVSAAVLGRRNFAGKNTSITQAYDGSNGDYDWRSGGAYWFNSYVTNDGSTSLLYVRAHRLGNNNNDSWHTGSDIWGGEENAIESVSFTIFGYIST